MTTQQFQEEEAPAITLETAIVTIARQGEEIKRLRQLVEETGYEDAKLFIQETHFLAVQAVGSLLEEMESARVQELEMVFGELAVRFDALMNFINEAGLGEQLAAYLREKQDEIKAQIPDADLAEKIEEVAQV